MQQVDVLDKADLKEFAQSLKLHKFKQNQRIFNHFDKSDCMYLIVQGKVGIYHPKPSYKTVQNEDRNNNRIVQVTNKEARALRTKQMLRGSNLGWHIMGRDEVDQECAEEQNCQHHNVSEQFDLVASMLKLDGKETQAKSENPLHNLKVKEFLKPDQNPGGFLKKINQNNFFRKKLSNQANILNENVLSQMMDRIDHSTNPKKLLKRGSKLTIAGTL